jgi:hypothetical protein
MFAKEAAFSARRMNSRLAEKSELLTPHDASPGASYLRRKGAQGKRDPNSPHR